jgi:hypothetical protein
VDVDYVSLGISAAIKPPMALMDSKAVVALVEGEDLPILPADANGLFRRSISCLPELNEDIR